MYLLKDWLLNGEVSFKHIIYVYCTGKAATPFYYIVVMVQLTLLTPWLVRMKKRSWLYAVTPVYIVWLYIFNLATGSMPRLYETFFPAWFGFYVLGLDCRAGKWDNVSKKMRGWWIAAALVVSIIEAFVLLNAGGAIGFASSQIRFGSFLYAWTITLVLMRAKDDSGERHCGRMLVSIGDCSYGIFYVHMAVLVVAKKIVSMLWVSHVWVLDFVSCFILTAVGGYVVVWVTRKIAKKMGAKWALKIIGF